MESKIFCDVGLIETIFLEKKISVKYIGYLQNIVSSLSISNKTLCFEGLISIKKMAIFFKINQKTVRRFLNYFEKHDVIPSRSKDKFLNDEHYIVVNNMYCKCFIILQNPFKE